MTRLSVSALVLGLLLLLAAPAGLLAQPPAAPAPPAPSPAQASSAAANELKVPNERVRQQIEERRRWHRGIVESKAATREQKAEAWGELGNLYHAYELFSLAEAAYRQAEELAPQDPRWPYYLGHLYRSTNQAAASLAGFARAVELAPDDVAAQVRLGEVLFDQARFAEAKVHLERALALEPRCAAAHFTLGLIANSAEDRTAPQRRQEAVRHFEAALALQPGASALRTPLGLAYRDLGRLDEAREQLRQAGKQDVVLTDPRMLAIYSKGDGLVEILQAGDKALAAGNLEEAARAYRAAVAGEPLYSLPRTRLSFVLLRLGDEARASEQLDLALRLAPDDAEANAQKGYLLQEGGKPREAIASYRKVLAVRPDDFPARLNLARALLETDQAAAAAEEYARLTERTPENPLPWLGKSSALLAAKRCAEAGQAIATGLERVPRDGLLAQAQARLLASCPDDGVRDGEKALTIATALYEARPSPEHAEAVAMAMAELGRWDEALTWQRRALEQAKEAKLTALAAEVQANLTLFEKRQPSRAPWPPRQWALLLGRT